MLQVTGHRQRHQVVPPEVSALLFHAALLIAAPGRAELALESAVRAEGDESLCLLPLMAAQNLLHRALQIVETQHPEYPAEIPEGQLVSLQKRLLAGVCYSRFKTPDSPRFCS